ncbi:MAG: hypothetical protein M1436_10255, partial [Acidobacteria bacterium]|nr:hypothetical protein [Acidobacteriota bacterium]
MRKRIWIAASVLAAAVTAVVTLYPQGRNAKGVAAPSATAFRILLGVGDTAPTSWDGSVAAKGGRVVGIQGWRFVRGDSTDSVSSWKASTRQSPGKNGRPGPMVENGVFVSADLSDANASFDVKTAQGSFSFQARDVGYGQSQSFLNGRVAVERVLNTVQLTSSPEEQDFPAIAQSGGEVYLSYVEFVHGAYDRSANRFTEAPKNFEQMTAPVGGDQVFLMVYSKSKRTWSTPIPVSAPKQDIMRTTVAVDGQKRAWVFWSANRNGNFDIYGKAYAQGRWSSEVRLTTDAGTDLNPVAAADASGRVWVAWQGFRNNNLEILATAQNGDRFGTESVVSFSPASDWDPAIAAAPGGDVAVSWDTYDKGDYDVYFRRMRLDGEVRMDAPVPVAASANFEARSSIAYDPQGRLWVAYEAGATKWGKDFGAYETSGVALYQSQNLRVKCFEGANAFATSDNLIEKLPGAPPVPLERSRKRGAEQTVSLQLPNPELYKTNFPTSPVPPAVPLNSLPRLTVDGSGTVYLAFRTAPVMQRVAIPSGTVWFEKVTYFDGASWKAAALAPNTDGGLDTRAALAAIAPGHLLMVSTGDHRQTVGGQARAQADLFASELQVGQRPVATQIKPLPAEQVAAPDAVAGPEKKQVSFIRNYRANVNSQKLQLMRGEFHRHTELSGDGGRDGSLVDAYRYLIDGASMDWAGCCDHVNGGREYSWWLEQKFTDAYKLGGNFVPMFSYERSVKYPEGHRNVVFAQRGIRVLSQLPLSDPDHLAPAPDTQMLYRYLRQFDGIVASHTSGTSMGTDWRDNDPILEPVVEIYQGDRQNYEMPNGPRAPTEDATIGGWKPLGFVSLA